MSIKIIVRHYWRSAFVVACILYLSFVHPSTFSKIPTVENEDKLVHLLMYGGLSFTLMFDFLIHQKPKYRLLLFVLIGMLFPILLGGVVEVIQPICFAPRTGSLGDFIANSIGVMMSGSVVYLMKREKLTKPFKRFY
jgi:VanZ family protein